LNGGIIIKILKKNLKVNKPEQETAELARSITWSDSRQSYFTVRWIDDVIDVTSKSDEERFEFIKEQKELIDRLYRKEAVNGLTPEENMLAVLIGNEKVNNSGLRSFISNMFALIEFDVYRKGRGIKQEELPGYSEKFARSAMDGILYFIGNEHRSPRNGGRYSAFYGSHIAHLLRDTYEDLANGFVNIPEEYLEKHGIGPGDINSDAYRAWVKSRVDEARQCFKEAKSYLNWLTVWRSKLVGYWYIARFESVLDTIERDGYYLRSKYKERRNLNTILKILAYSTILTIKQPVFSMASLKMRSMTRNKTKNLAQATGILSS
jgi:phytoene/squalene synthetase